MDTGTWGLYYNYTWWGNAIQTASSVIGKPDFFGSQFEMLTSQQPNRVVNGDFATDSDWTKDTGWTISGGLLNCNTTTSNNTRQLISSYSTSKVYLITYTVSNYVSGGVRIDLGYNNGTTRTANGTYTQQMSFVDSGAFNGYLRIFSNGASNLKIDNVSLQLERADNVEAVKCLADWIHETQILDV